MPRKLLQALLAIATFTVVWLVASPASATPLNGAPVCDPRGAVGFAPPPQIQDTELSLDIPADCFDVHLNPLDTRNAVPGRGVPPDFSVAREAANGTKASSIFDLVFVERLPILVAPEARPPSGVRLSLERPPRPLSSAVLRGRQPEGHLDPEARLA